MFLQEVLINFQIKIDEEETPSPKPQSQHFFVFYIVILSFPISSYSVDSLHQTDSESLNQPHSKTPDQITNHSHYHTRYHCMPYDQQVKVENLQTRKKCFLSFFFLSPLHLSSVFPLHLYVPPMVVFANLADHC